MTMLRQYIAKIYNYYKRTKAHYLFPFLTGATGVWLGMLLTPTIGAICFLISIYLFFVIFPLNKIHWVKLKTHRQHIISIIITLIIALFSWNKLIAIFPSNDPYKELLQTGTATVVIGIEPNSVFLNEFPIGYIQFLKDQEVFLGMGISPAKVETQIVDNQAFCKAIFDLDQTCKAIGNPISHLTKTEIAKINLNIIPVKSRIADGYAIFSFNSSVSTDKIPIPSQTMENDFIVIQNVGKYLKEKK